MKSEEQWRSEGPAGPATAGGGAEGARQGPPGRSSRRNPLARGPNKLLAGGPKIVATPLLKRRQESRKSTIAYGLLGG